MPHDAATFEDAALARRIAGAGARIDSAAESELYRRLAPRVRLYGLRHLRDPHAARDLVQQVLLLTLERLAERERSVVAMSFFADQPADQVGTALGLSGANVRVIRHRALGRLRQCLDADV